MKRCQSVKLMIDRALLQRFAILRAYTRVTARCLQTVCTNSRCVTAPPRCTALLLVLCLPMAVYPQSHASERSCDASFKKSRRDAAKVILAYNNLCLLEIWIWSPPQSSSMSFDVPLMSTLQAALAVPSSRLNCVSGLAARPVERLQMQ